MTLTVPCLFGLESLVADEMRRLHLQHVRAENGRVHFEGTLADIPRLNINLRCGARVLLERWRDKRSGRCAVSDAFALLHAVRQEGIWATRVSFVYSQEEHAVYYAENNHFDHIRKYVFQLAQPGKEPL